MTKGHNLICKNLKFCTFPPLIFPNTNPIIVPAITNLHHSPEARFYYNSTRSYTFLYFLFFPSIDIVMQNRNFYKYLFFYILIPIEKAAVAAIFLICWFNQTIISIFSFVHYIHIICITIRKYKEAMS